MRLDPAVRIARRSSAVAALLGLLLGPTLAENSRSPSSSIAEAAPDATSPSKESSHQPPPPRDGVCEHPALNKDGIYESSPFTPAQESACIAKTGASVVRRGGALGLKFNNGASRAYKNSTAAACKKGPYESCKEYMLYDYFPEHGLLLVNVGYGESQEWLLVSQKDGKEVRVVAQPGYSPGRKWLASVYWTEGPDDGNNGVDIVPADFDLIGSAFHYRPMEYELWEVVGWDGDDRLLLNVTWHPDGNAAGELVTWPAEAVRVKGVWRLNRWAPGSLRP